jgi:hypothetical protein
MLDASTVEDRTRPAIDDVGWVPIRMRFGDPAPRRRTREPEAPRPLRTSYPAAPHRFELPFTRR